jgi:hypothetical protein
MIDLETLESGDLAKLKKIPGWEMMVSAIVIIVSTESYR